MQSLLPVILAGGSGSRLWPMSRELYPKQFLSLCGDHTMLQTTLLRTSGLDTQASYVVCNEEHRFLVAEQARLIDHSLGTIILEPAAKNTAPAIGLAAVHAMKGGDDPLLLILSADHHIRDESSFRAMVAEGANIVGQNGLLIFGIVPTSPETGYGYIKKGGFVGEQGKACRVAKFVEKPTREIAEAYLNSGDYLWNSGMFMFRASSYLAELEKYRPDIFKACQDSISNGAADMDFYRPGSVFESCQSESIDYAVMEKTDNSVMIPLDAGWSDVGSWSSLWELSDRDQNGNSISGDVIDIRTENSYIHSEERLIATIGLENMVVVETADALLVANRDEVQDVKSIVERIKKCSRQEHYTHVKVYRPWGSYESIEEGQRFQVKRITVSPGASLSLQMHHHRSEHWIVVSGTAIVQRDEEEFMLSENESTYIPLGATHRLTNPGKVPLDLIEVQVGSYLGEDDIVRFDDNYGR